MRYQLLCVKKSVLWLRRNVLWLKCAPEERRHFNEKSINLYCNHLVYIFDCCNLKKSVPWLKCTPGYTFLFCENTVTKSRWSVFTSPKVLKDFEILQNFSLYFHKLLLNCFLLRSCMWNSLTMKKVLIFILITAIIWFALPIIVS